VRLSAPVTNKPINLRQARKRKERAAARSKGDANAAAHGLTKAQKDAAGTVNRRAERDWRGHKRDDEA
jgi:hypothetical protein